MIDRALLAEFTWTGKTIGERSKTPFKNLKNINDFMYDTVNMIEGGYSQSLFLDHLKNKILKYAYE